MPCFALPNCFRVSIVVKRNHYHDNSQKEKHFGGRTHLEFRGSVNNHHGGTWAYAADRVRVSHLAGKRK